MSFVHSTNFRFLAGRMEQWTVNLLTRPCTYLLTHPLINPMLIFLYVHKLPTYIIQIICRDHLVTAMSTGDLIKSIGISKQYIDCAEKFLKMKAKF